MKQKFLKIALLSAISFTVLDSCQKVTPAPDTIQISQKEVTLGPEGGSFTIDVTSSTEFTVSNNASWLQMSPKETSYTSGTITFTAQTNSEITDRQARVIFKTTQVADTLYVTQSAAEDELYNEFIGCIVPGFYTQSFGNFTYEDFTSQYSITQQPDKGLSTHRILTIKPGRFVTLSGLPSGLSQGSECSLTIVQNFTDMMTNRYTRTFTVEKTEGPLVWIYSHDYRQGAIITNEPTSL